MSEIVMADDTQATNQQISSDLEAAAASSSDPPEPLMALFSSVDSLEALEADMRKVLSLIEDLDKRAREILSSLASTILFYLLLTVGGVYLQGLKLLCPGAVGITSSLATCFLLGVSVATYMAWYKMSYLISPMDILIGRRELLATSATKIWEEEQKRQDNNDPGDAEQHRLETSESVTSRAMVMKKPHNISKFGMHNKIYILSVVVAGIINEVFWCGCVIYNYCVLKKEHSGECLSAT